MNPLKISAQTVLVLALAALLSACAGPRSYVALLTSPDGTLGQVTLTGAQGAQVLTQDHTAAALDGSTPPFEVTPKQLQKDFGAALAARPPLPEQFLLYFNQGSELTAESKLVLERLLARAKSRTSLDISVIGHTDTQGASAANQALALERANAMAEQLRSLGLQDAVMAVESHGERNLLAPTADEVAEPRNRRVEITLR
ncbi:OmpA family protein [Rhodoferax sp. PAMC 29310]|uniref:OmpA family protein n=1 Tax=Rhodoferax sp. PAMC 29310 TaxID=2822760 RepID=UPI001B3194DB|nr:OmpA family protein [Rhodoferax sp. PAMC 29310]